MRISEKGLSLIKEFEGCQLNAYRCPSNVLTIGWGHTENVTPNQTITQEEADNLLINDMVQYENYVNNCSELAFTPNQNQFDALVSFTYNCGQGSLSMLVQNRDASTVAEKLLLYVNGSNGVLQGLVRRREAERSLFIDGNFTVSPIVQEIEQSPIQKAKEFVGSRALELQQKLIAKGYNCGGYGADGSFGQGTYDSLIQFQKDNGLVSDGLAGDKTFAKLNEVVTQSNDYNWIVKLQSECNAQGLSNQKVDGYSGQNTLNGCPTLKIGSQGNITKLLQEKLGINNDGIFGNETLSYVIAYQNANGLDSDGIVGRNTWKKLLGL